MSEGRGPISDLVAAGCFVLTGGEFAAGELIRLEIHFPNEIAFVWGYVVYAATEMGFALRFAFAGNKELRAFHRVIESWQKHDR